MKKLILLFIIALAVTTSIFANAGSRILPINVPIKSAQYDVDSMIVQLSGYLPTRCAASPHPTLRLDEKTGDLILVVEAFGDNSACMMMTVVGGKFDLAFDIRALKSTLVELSLNTEGTYTIRTADSKISAQINFGQVPTATPYATASLDTGVIQAHENGSLVVVSKNDSIEISSPFISAEKYVGKRVEVQGHAAGVNKPIFIVTGINTTAY
jgi:hypothetical protein